MVKWPPNTTLSTPPYNIGPLKFHRIHKHPHESWINDLAFATIAKTKTTAASATVAAGMRTEHNHAPTARIIEYFQKTKKTRKQ